MGHGKAGAGSGMALASATIGLAMDESVPSARCPVSGAQCLPLTMTGPMSGFHTRQGELWCDGVPLAAHCRRRRDAASRLQRPDDRRALPRARSGLCAACPIACTTPSRRTRHSRVVRRMRGLGRRRRRQLRRRDRSRAARRRSRRTRSSSPASARRARSSSAPSASECAPSTSNRLASSIALRPLPRRRQTRARRRADQSGRRCRQPSAHLHRLERDQVRHVASTTRRR